jgi:chemotaxis signal transduction protein
MSRGGACLLFRLGDRPFGLPLDQVGEIAPVERLHPVPLAPRPVLGLMNLRGQVITLVDLGAILDLVVSASGRTELALVLAAPRQNLALRVLAPVEIGEVPAEDDGDAVEVLSAQDLAARLELGLEEGFRTGATTGAGA